MFSKAFIFRGFILLGIAIGSSVITIAQTGPGGVGNSNGINNQPTNVLWLDAGDLSLANNAAVTTWSDKSGSGNDMTQFGAYNTPVYQSNGLASGAYPVVRFDGTERYLSVSDNSTISGLSEVSMILVFQSSALGGSPRGIISKRLSSTSNEEYSLFSYTSDYLDYDIHTTSDSRSTTSPTAISTATDYVVSTIYNGSIKQIFLQTTQAGSNQSKTGTINDGTAPLILGALNENYGTYFSGDLAEVILYSRGLNEAERLIVENYLAEKYAISITNDFYSGYSGNYFYDVAGVGNSNGSTHTKATSAGMTLSFYDGSFGTGEFVMTGHANDAATIVSDSLNGNATMQQRWSKSWYIDKTGNMNVSMAFDFGTVINGQYPQQASDYRLIVRNGANYQEVTTSNVYVSGDNLIFEVTDANLVNGYYSIATVNSSTAPLNGGAQRVWYSYKNGNWEDPLIWTLDGAVNPLYVNPSSSIPSGSDKVVINSGKTVKMLDVAGTADYNNANVSTLDITGSLDLGTSYGHSFGVISGSGTILMQGSSLDNSDNFPSGDATSFIGQGGGTVEITGGGILMNKARTFNNVNINLSSGTALLTADLSMNGNFSVNNGTFQINDASTTTALNITLYGNAYISSAGSVTTGSANARHQFNFYGNLTNDGTIAFTQRTSPVTGAQATDGIVDANFLSSNSDQQIQCNNTAHFYRIEIDKGDDPTYVLNIDAAGSGDFNLNGYAAEGHAQIAQLTSNANALGLIKGTVRLGDNVTVSALNTTGNYNISEAAVLWIDGGAATKSGGTAIVPYGGLEVSGGQLTASVNSGVTTRGNGYLKVTGGKVKMNQFRTSIYGVTNQGGYTQTAGEVYITAGSTSTDYYAMSLTYEGNTFEMSGGQLTVNTNSRGGIFINGTNGNYNVTGGEIICELDNNNPFVITSKAPFYNLTIRKTTNNTGYVILDGGTSANGSSDPRTLAAQPLTVYNDIIIENASAGYVDFDGVAQTTNYDGNFNANGQNLTIGGNFKEQDGATFTSGTNTITFNGSGVSLLQFSNSATQTINNLTVAKNYTNQGLQIIGGNSTTAFEIDGEFRLEKGKLFCDNYNVDALGAMYLADTVGDESSIGKLSLKGASLQTISTNDEGAIYDMEVNNANGISLDGTLMTDTLALTLGIFDINTNKLTVNGAINGSSFSTAKMIQTAGNASDGGLEIYFDGAITDPAARLFPVGTNANSTVRYTPATLDLENVTDDGYVYVSLADKVLATTDPSGGDILSFYWQLGHSSFSAAPNVTTLSVIASEDDDVDGSDSNATDDATSLPDNWVMGKVEAGEDSDDTPTSDFAYNAMQTPGSISVYTITYTGNDLTSGAGPYTLTKANYTAGKPGRFAASPTVFYTRKTANNDQNWNVTSNWSITVTQGPANAPRWPGQNGNSSDIVIIGAHSDIGYSQIPVRLDVNVNTDIAALIFEDAGTGEQRGRLFPQSGTSHAWGEVSGDGEIQLFFTSSATVPTFDASATDFGDFFNVSNSTWNLSHEGGAGASKRVTMPTFPSEFPNLRVTATGGTNGGTDGWGNQYQVEFANDITVNSDLQIANRAALYVQGNIDIAKSLQIGVGYGHGRLRFPNGATAYCVTVGDNVILGQTSSGTISGNYIDVEPGNTNNITHSLEVAGSIILKRNGNSSYPYLDFYLSSSENQVDLILTGESTDSLTNDSGIVPDLYRLIINKGSDTTSTFTFNDNFNLHGTANDALASDKALVLQSGKLILDAPGINLTLSDGGADFEVPDGAGLELAQGTYTVSGDDIGILLDGLLRVSGATLEVDDAVNNGNNYIEYSTSGSGVLEISGGSLTVGSQIRRSLTSTSGALTYKQTGGSVTLGKRAAPETTRGVFEITSSGSFIHTGGDFTLVRGINSTTVPSLLLEPGDSDLTGSSIIIGNTDTPSGSGSSQIGIKSSVALGNLSINNSSGNNPVVYLYSRPLTVSGTLSIESGAGLNANSYDLTLTGDFTNNGTYLPNSNTTFFSASSGTQSFSGTGTSTFYNLTKSGTGTLSLSQDITVSNDLTVNKGTLSHGTNTINVSGDVTVKGTISTTGGQGIVFNGSSQQELLGQTNTNVDLGRITIDNLSGVQIPDGNGYQFTINDALRLNKGVLDVGGSLLTIGKNGSIEEVSTFSATNMIQTNSSFTDNGVKKVFSGMESSFTFPVGDSKYTPFNLITISSIDEDGYLIVRPSNERHPAITDDPLTAEDETLNALQYYWVVKSGGLTNFSSGTAQFVYDQSDVSVTGSFTENDYIAARLTTTQYQWDKAYAGTAVSAANNTLTFPLDQSSVFAGDYTAGINNAFRDIPQYRSNGNVNFTAIANWEVSLDGGTTWASATTTPVGAIVDVRTGDTLTINDNNVRLLSTTIASGARLEVNPAYYGTRLGDVYGQGTLVLQSEVFPTGNYENFLTCSGGELEYTSANSYPVLSGIPNVRAVTLTGSGSRTLPANAVTVCNDLTINGPTLVKSTSDLLTVDGNLILTSGAIQFTSSQANITVQGNTTLTSGIFSGYNGASITFNGDLTNAGATFSGNSSDFVFSGSGVQQISGTYALDHMTVNSSGAGLDLTSGGNISIANLLTMTDGIITTSAANTVTLGASANYAGASVNSYFNGPVTKNSIASAATYSFPVGKGGRYAPAAISNVQTGSQNWTVEYFTNVVDASIPTSTSFDHSDPGSGYNALNKIQTTDRWSISSSGSNTAFVKLTYGNHNSYPGTDLIRVIWWDTPNSRWENQGGIVSGTSGSGTVISENAIHFSTQQFGLGNAPQTVLPVELINFKGTLWDNGDIRLTWQTVSELNNDHFEIERSIDGDTFKYLGAVTGAGTSKSLLNYSFVDKQPVPGLNYYRLKQVDFDGAFEYSPLIMINNDHFASGLTALVYPNPIQGNEIKVTLTTGNETSEIQFIIYDPTGKRYVDLIQQPVVGTAYYSVPVSEQLNTGIYYLLIRQADYQKVIRLMAP